MAQPFAVDPSLSIPFPSPEELRHVLSGATRRSREIVVRLWLTEGCPAAFRNCPSVYEDIRGWLSSRMQVHSKEITLIGSARIGYSLAPPPEFGRPFGNKSDLDLSVISRALFDRLVSTFAAFSNDYKNGTVVPRSERERELWGANLAFGERNIPRGFFDANKVPNFDRYPVAQQVNQAMWALLKKLEVTAGAPKVRRASTRVYRDWQSFIQIVCFNLRAALPEQLGTPVRK
jgi:hypothetical protein